MKAEIRRHTGDKFWRESSWDLPNALSSLNHSLFWQELEPLGTIGTLKSSVWESKCCFTGWLIWQINNLLTNQWKNPTQSPDWTSLEANSFVLYCHKEWKSKVKEGSRHLNECLRAYKCACVLILGSTEFPLPRSKKNDVLYGGKENESNSFSAPAPFVRPLWAPFSTSHSLQARGPTWLITVRHCIHEIYSCGFCHSSLTAAQSCLNCQLEDWRPREGESPTGDQQSCTIPQQAFPFQGKDQNKPSFHQAF